MDKERINEEAKAFQKENSCFIHVECNNGQHEAVMAGDGRAIITSLATIMDSFATSCQAEFKDLLRELFVEHMKQKIAEEAGISRKEATSFSMPKLRKTDDDS